MLLPLNKKYSVRIKLVLLTTALLAVLWYVFVPKPDITQSTTYSTAFYDSSGKLLRLNLATDDRYRLWMPIERIPLSVQQATLLYEDQYFYQHIGIDFIALTKAFYTSYIKRSRRVGASTITMQVARLRFGMNTHVVLGKIEQIFRALQIERHYNKKQILEAYFNLAPYGSNIEGIGAASLIYFNKPAFELNLPESLLLSLVPQNPSKRNPIKQSAKAILLDARQTLFSRWLEAYPSDKNWSATMQLPISVHSSSELPFEAPHFINNLQSKFPHLESAEYKTTINLSLQKLLERHGKSYIKRREREGITNTSAILLNYQTMEIVAELGSVDFFNNTISGQVNGTRAKRSPGSTLKPFIYALAIDEGLIHPLSLVKDAPKRFGGYTPENYDQQFLGPISATDSLVLSRNVPAVNLMYRLKKVGLYDLLVAADIKKLQPKEFYGLALALGGNEVTMLELVKLYAVLANLGMYQNEIILQQEPERDLKNNTKKRLLSPEAAYLTLQMLSKNNAVDEISFQQQSRKTYPVYWKTGTSFAFRDAWSVGIVGPYVLATWVGNFSGEGHPSFIGRQAAAPLFFEIIRSLESYGLIKGDIKRGGLNIEKVDICSTTGDLPNVHCPKTQKGLFIPGKSPIKISDVHREIFIDKASGSRACRFDESTTTKAIYEFWPSDLIRLFKQAGIVKRQPPAYLASCAINDTSTLGSAPTITSPSNLISYTVRASKLTQESLPFTATTDTDSSALYWFVNNSFVGKVERDTAFFWQPKIGIFEVKVVDNLGRSSSTTLRVKLVQ
ncbi:penicillin-binding protein 1C [Pseudoalteromonas aliena]|uniref:peptidoglycan glycosyltransferase n=1 Tax=Pseudoalteromonas aliena TaxID=247523 RepID=A0A1Q2H2J1_9GAMM|nr:penicillin-binding protein 1C [Pseudoalteromonas aliena]